MGFGTCERKDSRLLGEMVFTGRTRLDSDLGLAGGDGLSRTSSGRGKSSRSSSLCRRCVRSYTKSLSTGFTRFRIGRFEVGLSSGGSLFGGFCFLAKSSTGVMQIDSRRARVGLRRFLRELGSGVGTLVVELSVTFTDDVALLSNVTWSAVTSTKDISVVLVSQIRLTASTIELIGSQLIGGVGGTVAVFLVFSTGWKLISELMSSTSPS